MEYNEHLGQKARRESLRELSRRVGENHGIGEQGWVLTQRDETFAKGGKCSPREVRPCEVPCPTPRVVTCSLLALPFQPGGVRAPRTA